MILLSVMALKFVLILALARSEHELLMAGFQRRIRNPSAAQNPAFGGVCFIEDARLAGGNAMLGFLKQDTFTGFFRRKPCAL